MITNSLSNLKFHLKKADYKVKMQGSAGGRKWQLSIVAEIFEVTPSLFVVELKKAGGDTLDYEKFYEEKLRPGLKDIVWAWHGDHE